MNFLKELDNLFHSNKLDLLLTVVKAKIAQDGYSPELWFALSKILEHKKEYKLSAEAEQYAKRLLQTIYYGQSSLEAEKEDSTLNDYDESDYLCHSEAFFQEVDSFDYFEAEPEIDKPSGSKELSFKSDNNELRLTPPSGNSIPELSLLSPPSSPKQNHVEEQNKDFICPDEVEEFTESLSALGRYDDSLLEESDDISTDFELLDEESGYQELEEYDFLSDESFSDLEDIDYIPPQDNPEKILFNKKITPEDKAIQVATAFIHKNEWGYDSYDLLSIVFCTRGYGRIASALEKYISEGLTEEEFALAYEFREICREQVHYSLMFCINGKSRYYPFNLSWLKAIKIIRDLTIEFSAVPTIDDLYQLVECNYDIWFHSDSLRRSFRSFTKYFNVKMLSLGVINRFVLGINREMEGFGCVSLEEEPEQILNVLTELGFTESEVQQCCYLAYYPNVLEQIFLEL